MTGACAAVTVADEHAARASAELGVVLALVAAVVCGALVAIIAAARNHG